MKKTLTILSIVFIVLAMSVAAGHDKHDKNKEQCTTIKEGVLTNPEGELYVLGFDNWGYNYQAHLFKGLYCDAYKNAEWCQPYADVSLKMKWNEAWLSNKDCDGDGKLDRHYGFDSYIGSGAKITNHQSGVDEDGTSWEYHSKIVAKPTAEDDCVANGHTEIWGDFCKVFEETKELGDDKKCDKKGKKGKECQKKDKHKQGHGKHKH
jgi:hypothetical protein